MMPVAARHTAAPNGEGDAACASAARIQPNNYFISIFLEAYEYPTTDIVCRLE